jgi:nicotinamidase-related amidase
MNDLLIIVDVQNGFINQNSRHIIKTIQNVVTFFKQRNVHLVYTQFINHSGSPYEKLLNWHRLKFSPEIDICDELFSPSIKVLKKMFIHRLAKSF